MTTPASEKRRSRLLPGLLGSLAVLGAAGGSLYLFQGCSSTDPSEAKSAAVAPAHHPPIEIPRFGKAEEAKKYFDAMTEGDQRAIELLDRALAAAKADKNAAPSYIAELERDRSARAARLAAYQAARNDPSLTLTAAP